MNPHEVATQWYQRVVTVGHGHYRAALWYSKLNLAIGLPTVVFATIVGTSVFATLQTKPEFWWQVIVGVMSILTAILSALQSFFSFGDKADKHRIAGSKYNAIGRELELWRALASPDPNRLDDIRGRIDSLAQESPHIPTPVHKFMQNKVAEFADQP